MKLIRKSSHYRAATKKKQKSISEADVWQKPRCVAEAHMSAAAAAAADVGTFSVS